LRHELDNLVFAFVVRIRVQKILPGSQRSVDIHLSLPLDHSKIEQGVRLVRLIGQRVVELGDRSVGISLVPVSRRHVGADPRILRPELQGAPVVLARRRELLRVVIEVPDLGEQVGIVWICA
jgi:hypothetical protein